MCKGNEQAGHAKGNSHGSNIKEKKRDVLSNL